MVVDWGSRVVQRVGSVVVVIEQGGGEQLLNWGRSRAVD